MIKDNFVWKIVFNKLSLAPLLNPKEDSDCCKWVLHSSSFLYNEMFMNNISPEGINPSKRDFKHKVAIR